MNSINMTDDTTYQPGNVAIFFTFSLIMLLCICMLLNSFNFNEIAEETAIMRKFFENNENININTLLNNS